eukprot:scaffold146996_cov77-Cyclotella_meneghiniana.AAC.2
MPWLDPKGLQPRTKHASPNRIFLGPSNTLLQRTWAIWKIFQIVSGINTRWSALTYKIFNMLVDAIVHERLHQILGDNAAAEGFGAH